MSKQNDDPITGNFIFAKEIKNDGEINSEGMRSVNYLHTDKYSGKGKVISRQVLEKWFQKWWAQLLFLTLGGLVVAFFTYIFGWT